MAEFDSLGGFTNARRDIFDYFIYVSHSGIFIHLAPHGRYFLVENTKSDKKTPHDSHCLGMLWLRWHIWTF
jgi:hypothetical protein